MSRVAKKAVIIPKGVDVAINGQELSVKGPKGLEKLQIHPAVSISSEQGAVNVSQKVDTVAANAMAGTTRALIQNVVTGLSTGFERRLTLVGVGYRAQTQGQTLNLTLGLSHPVHYAIPEGIIIETPQPTEIVIKGTNRQLVGQVAADIRSYRPPEPYKGKGIRYSDEVIVLKETKKK